MQQPEFRRDSASAVPKPGTATGASAAEVDTAPHDTPPVLADEVGAAELARARALAAQLEHELLCAAVVSPVVLQTLNNALMDVYRERRHRVAYELLFELNTRPFALIAARIMRMTGCRGDLQDILQETFLAIYRYPSKFCPEKPNAFRNWSYSIIRNTVYRHLNKDGKEGVPADSLAESLADPDMATPAEASETAESDRCCRKVYLLLLSLYSHAYVHELKPRDRLALELVEVRGMGYREAADLLSIRLENFKMIVCRARKKILQSMIRVLGTRTP